MLKHNPEKAKYSVTIEVTEKGYVMSLDPKNESSVAFHTSFDSLVDHLAKHFGLTSSKLNIKHIDTLRNVGL